MLIPKDPPAAGHLSRAAQENTPLMKEPYRIVKTDAVWEITLDRPKANAIDTATSLALARVFTEFRDDPGARVAILTGAGERFFSAGWDLKEAAATASSDDYGPGGFAGLTELFDLEKPVIAAVNGQAVGGGFEMALCCDVIIAVEGVEFFLPEALIGVIPDAGGVLRLPRRLPRAVAMEMMLTGKRLSAADALRFGLVSEVVTRAELMPAARRLAARMLAAAPLAAAAIKATVAATESVSIEQGFAMMRSGRIEAYERLRRSSDYFEGARAFAERRPPVWRGR
jgi:crotonobetainyl-CoA hydratase